MIYIDEDGDLKQVEGTAEDLCSNAATILAMVMDYAEENASSEEVKTAIISGLTEATLRTVMDLCESEAVDAGVIEACKTVGATGRIENIVIKGKEGIAS